MSGRTTVAAFLVVALAGIAALVGTAGGDRSATAFSLYVPTAGPVATVSRHEIVCQGPFHVATQFQGLQLFVTPNDGHAAVFRVTVRNRPAGAVLATARTGQNATSGALTATLDAPVAEGRHVSVCLENPTRAPITLLGWSPSDRSGMLTVAGRRTHQAAALVLLRKNSNSLLSLLPAAFRRASLFRPDWVAAWTFWLLTTAVGLAFAVAIAAVVGAEHADSRTEEGPPAT